MLRRDEERALRARLKGPEYSSYSGAPVEVRCPDGHHMRSYSRRDAAQQIVSVLWVCMTCRARVEVGG